ncbi:MAG: hypothetical protein ACRDTH_27960 [Pseudonocardiaceae bacterium]
MACKARYYSGEVLEVGDCGGDGLGVTGEISGGRVEQPEHDPAVGGVSFHGESICGASAVPPAPSWSSGLAASSNIEAIALAEQIILRISTS